ncbi:MAG TPA: AMP-binding protein [Streptosporangiaceae bacterium]|nr:AMP-binding protein [Streptosporangiaceae bacterium]
MPDETGSEHTAAMPGSDALSYSHGAATTALIGETIGANLRRVTAAHPHAEALVDVPTGRRWTYAQFNADTDTLASGLIAAGLAVGDRVGIWAPNCAEWAQLQYATAKAGVILVNINPAYRGHELGYALRQSGVRLLFSAESFKTSDYRAMIEEASGDLPDLERVIYLGTGDWDALFAAGGRHREPGGPGADVSDDDTDASGYALAAREASLSFDDPINIQYTSGTTGFPKGATLSHHNILNNGFFIGEGCGYSERDRVCIPVPFYHCFGMVLGNLACTTHGACIVIPAPGFDPAQTLRAVQAERCTSLYGVPTMFIAELGLADFPSYDLSTLRTGIMAGSPCPVEIMKRVVSEMNMTEVTICYGMTETSPVSAQTTADDDMERRVSTVGRVHPHVEVKIIDPETGRVLPRGMPGEMCTRGYSVMLGYWNEPEKTAEAIDAARWMHTGDIAVMDQAGYLNIVGRIKDMVIRGGENVYPREVEEFLYAHPAIEDVQVIGVPDVRYGEELCAWVKLRPGHELTADQIRSYCQGKIAHYKIPRYIRFSQDFPMTVTGKVQKFRMRETSVTELGLEIASQTRTA